MKDIRLRRLDISLAKLDEMLGQIPEEERDQLLTLVQWNLLHTLSRLRGMELAEECIRPKVAASSADVYDRLVVPGSPLIPTLLMVAAAVVREALGQAEGNEVPG